MDVGTGSVLFASSLVARHDRDKSTPLLGRLKQAVLSSLPMLVVGGVRLALHKSLDYQEHISEYGVHWNFFLSLAVVVVLSSLLEASSKVRLGICGILMLSYETCLHLGLEDYIFRGERNNFFSANREGILGCVGFFCIYQIGLGLKPYILDSKEYFLNLCKASAVFTFVSRSLLYVLPASRRLVFYS